MDPLEPGDPRRLGPHRLLGRLGAGGMGVVYLGRSRAGRLVAVKVIRERFAADPRYRARFRREVAAARRVTGAFTAPVLDADPDAATPWLATAYLPGLSLRDAIARYGPLPPESVRALAAGLAEALAAVHRAGVVHRDLKPANVMLTAAGPRVIDFGIARPEDAGDLTRVGATLGTPGFMAPEQIEADEPVGPAADVFTYGAVLAYAATGTEPFGTGDARARRLRVKEVRADLDAVTEPWLLELVTSCLRKDPRDRPSAEDLVRRLAVPEGPPLEGTGWLPPPIAEEIDRRAAEEDRPPAPAGGLLGRRRLIAVVGTGAVTAAVAGVPLLGRGADRDDGRPRRSSAPRASAVPPPQPVPRWRTKVSDDQPALHVADGVILAEAADEVRALDPRTGRVLWERPAPLPVAVGGNAAYLATNVNPVLTAVRAGSGKVLWSHRVPFGSFAFRQAAAGSLLCSGGTGRLRGLDAGTGGQRWTAGVNAEHGLAAAEGVVVALSETEMTGLDARDGRRKWSYRLDNAWNLRVGHGLAFACGQDAWHAVRLEDGKAAWRRPNGGTGFGCELGGGNVYLSKYDGTVIALRAATGEPVWSRRIGRGEGAGYGHANSLGLSGDRLYVGGTDRRVYALDAADGRVLWSYGADSNLTDGPVGLAGLVFVGTRDGHVLALAPPSGEAARPGGAGATP
ncbi:serine/threonine-protein kinase [Thermomonospora cellulosilytica]|uniref:Outer membrane protein assembly factor BamB n=1 Tax=Thermomonospora cellulosilytica TaxID=1411118 RepID=A0A7W3N2H2_9ACTN|nr:serine/threonine-protein kinase [Thermomonospora cellulosilytica]MBA9006351.1 outer membrane protein assembly factor BamB [Thermomonospora cellulosilytica]